MAKTKYKVGDIIQFTCSERITTSLTIQKNETFHVSEIIDGLYTKYVLGRLSDDIRVVVYDFNVDYSTVLVGKKEGELEVVKKTTLEFTDNELILITRGLIHMVHARGVNRSAEMVELHDKLLKAIKDSALLQSVNEFK